MKVYSKRKPLDRKIVKLRAAWLEKTYPKEWHDKRITRFSMDVGIDRNTVYRWFSIGREPLPLYMEKVVKKFPTFPV